MFLVCRECFWCKEREWAIEQCLNSCTFCMHPFTGLATREDGAIKVCCRSQPIGFIQNETLEEVWNGDACVKYVGKYLNDERPDVCKPCFDLEDQGVQSLRQRHTAGVIPEARVNLYPDALRRFRPTITTCRLNFLQWKSNLTTCVT